MLLNRIAKSGMCYKLYNSLDPGMLFTDLWIVSEITTIVNVPYCKNSHKSQPYRTWMFYHLD